MNKCLLVFYGLVICMLPVASGLAQQGRWDLLTTYNQVNNRSECSMAVSNGKLYLLGGEGNTSVEEFDPKTMSWTKKSDAPVNTHHFQAVAVESSIYILEAFDGGTYPNQTNLSRVVIYNTDSNNWSFGSGLPADRRRSAAGAAEYQGKLYLVAGIQHGHASGTTNMFDVYDPKTDKWTSLPNAPHIRDHCEATVAGDKLYVVGGRNTSYRDPNHVKTFYSQTVLEVDVYDFKTGKWSTLPAKLPLGSGGGSLVNLNGTLYYIGGERETATEKNAPRKNTYYLNTLFPTKWMETGPLNTGRNGMSAVVLNNRIYVFGGLNNHDPSPLEVYTLYSDLVELL